MKLDYGYITRLIEQISGVPVRAYRDGKVIFSSFPAFLPRDPAELYKDELFGIAEHVGYYCTPYFHYYAVLNAPDVRIVAGPTSQVMTGDGVLKKLAFEADVPPDGIGAFVDGMRAVRRLPVEKLLQILCAVNHFLNGGEKLELSGIAISGAEQEELKNAVELKRTSRVYEEDNAKRQVHDTLAVEEAIAGIVRKGDSVALRRWMSAAPAVNGGILAGNQLRHLRNLFIVTATLVSRAAIQGGMAEDDAFSLSDAYIQRVELVSEHNAILNLQYNMILEFTEQVEKLRQGRRVTKLSVDVANYVRHHLSEPVSVEKMAEELSLSRPYLSARFRRDTGVTLTDFILSEKTEEAKRLIRYTDKSLTAISSYLAFSSQSHFIRVFRKYAGFTPGEYSERHRK